MFGAPVENVSAQREVRLATLREALDLLGATGVLVGADLDLVFETKPPAVMLESGTWDFDAERKLAADLRSVMDRLAGLVYRLEREHRTEVVEATRRAA